MESSYKKEIYKAWMNIVIMQKGLMLGIIWTLKSVIGCPAPKNNTMGDPLQSIDETNARLKYVNC